MGNFLYKYDSVILTGVFIFMILVLIIGAFYKADTPEICKETDLYSLDKSGILQPVYKCEGLKNDKY